MPRSASWLPVAALLLCLGCSGGEEGWPWARNMADSPAPQPQQEAYHKIEGTVPVQGGEPSEEGAEGESPVNPERENDSAEALERGRAVFDRYCAVCHGPDATGRELPDDFITPDLTEEDYVERSDGDIYVVITEGGLNMPSYRGEIRVRDRWLVINYLRTLQGSHGE